MTKAEFEGYQKLNKEIPAICDFLAAKCYRCAMVTYLDDTKFQPVNKEICCSRCNPGGWLPASHDDLLSSDKEVKKAKEGPEKSHIPRESKEWIEKLLDDWRERKFQELRSNRHCFTRAMVMADSVKRDILRPAIIHEVISNEPVELSKLVKWPTPGIYNTTGGVLPIDPHGT